jgi:hypothetical protein
VSEPEDTPDSSKTVFMPSPPAGGPQTPSEPQGEGAAPVGNPQEPPPPSLLPPVSEPEDAPDSSRTVFMPPPPAGGPQTPPQPRDEGAAPVGNPQWEPPPLPSLPAPAPPQPTAPGAGGRIAVGMTLNHIFEVRRFIARGGMGEVYEGVNINTDERVAVKVILSHLALDPNVQGMFRKEARTLTRLSHPALVQYRVLAQEPTLGVLYIVTEYIDGTQLSDQIGTLKPTAEELVGVTRRLAAGLQAAHELGAIHRDIAPDNILLPEGRLDQAKIIDFGIAKDLDPSNKTIVGDGFAGKLGFVAPEQFGDFDRQIGPWTDVYSLALLILTLAAGRAIDMGSTLVEAIDRRRAGPDLSVAPESLRPVLAAMLKPNPQERLRSMDKVLKALDDVGAAPAPPPVVQPAQAAPSRRAEGKSRLPLMLGAGGAVVVALLGAGVFFLSRQGAAPAGSGGGGAASPDRATASPAGGGLETVRNAVETALPGVSCTWMDIDEVSESPQGAMIRLSGVAGAPAEAQQAVLTAAKASGAHVGGVDVRNVFPINPTSCAPLNAFRAFREPSAQGVRRFTAEQSVFELLAKNPPCPVLPAAKAVVDLNVGNPQQNFSLIGMDQSGRLQQLFADRPAFLAFQKQYPDFVADKGADSFASTACNTTPGLVGELLITGQGPFDFRLPDAAVTDKGKAVDAAWLQSFTAAARANGWKTNMVWYRVANDQAAG